MQHKILIIDDSMFLRGVLGDIVSVKGEVLEAENANVGIEKFKEHKPNIVLLDIIMPGGDEEGIRALKEIIKYDPKACVVMISAVGQNQIIEQCKMLGAANYIVKPFQDEQILAVLDEYLN